MAPAPFLVVLGIAQDGGVPHAGCRRPCCAAAWRDPALRRRVSCLGLVDPASGSAWLLDATPDLPSQLHELEEAQNAATATSRFAGIFLTHGHIGHYLGLAQLGREALSVHDLPVYTASRMAALLRGSAPWDQLVRLGQLRLIPLEDGVAVEPAAGLRVTPFLVPHRGEYTETAGFLVEGPNRSAVYLPDIDGWDLWTPGSLFDSVAAGPATGGNGGAGGGGGGGGIGGTSSVLSTLLRRVDAAWIDGTFFDDGELTVRDPSEIPHPRIAYTLRALEALAPAERGKVRFTHLNHTNPALDPASPAAARIASAGCRVASEGERFEL